MTRVTSGLRKDTGHWVQPCDDREVMSVIGNIGIYSTGQQFAWRGMSSVDFAVTSSANMSSKADIMWIISANERASNPGCLLARELLTVPPAASP